MMLLDTIARWFPPPRLTKQRIAFALAIAAAADALQIAVGPLGWVGTVQVIDGIAAVLTCLLLGFHLLLLPTFLLELFPVVDMLPTWTGCVVLVVTLRRRAERNEVPPVRVQAEVSTARPASAPPPILPPTPGADKP